MGLETMAIVGATAGLIGTGISAYGQYQQGKAQEAMARYNAKLSEQQAEQEGVVSAENARRRREMNRRRIGQIRASLAGSGVSLTEGSYLDAIGQTTSELELATLDDINQSRRRQEAYLNEATMQRWQGSQASSAGNIAAASTLFGGIANTGSNMYDIRRSFGSYKGEV